MVVLVVESSSSKSSSESALSSIVVDVTLGNVVPVAESSPTLPPIVVDVTLGNVVPVAESSPTLPPIVVDVTLGIAVPVAESSVDRTTAAEAIPTVANSAMTNSAGKRILLNMCPFLSVNDDHNVTDPPIMTHQPTVKPRLDLSQAALAPHTA